MGCSPFFIEFHSYTLISVGSILLFQVFIGKALRVESFWLGSPFLWKKRFSEGGIVDSLQHI